MTVKVKEELSHICQIIAETVDAEKIYLFGSYAYGTPSRDSDYDLCVLVSDMALASCRRGQTNSPRPVHGPGHAAGCDRVSYRSLSAEASTALPGTKNCERGGGPV